MSFLSLTLHLRPIAEGAILFFQNRYGIRSTQWNIEKPIAPDAPYATTFYGATNDYHFLCVDVLEASITSSLEAFVTFCKERNLPVKLFLAYDPESEYPKKDDVRIARSRGLGILEVNENGQGTLLFDALSLSLTGVRVDLEDFPPRYRTPVATAENTFKNGDPSKGCSQLYDEIEAVSRRLAQRTHRRKYWNNFSANRDFQGNWAPLMRVFMNELDESKCPTIPRTLLAQVYAISDPRNQSAHRPRSLRQLKERDRRLRTRFETARDLLLDLVRADQRTR